MKAGLSCDVVPIDDRGLLALQGPAAAAVLSAMAPGVETMPFMTWTHKSILGRDCFVSRAGYTGEDGYEISVPADAAEELARALLAHEDVEPIGLGARDTLRLEAGLCLYGHDIDTTTTPIEAALTWTIAKSRRESGGFPGAEVILGQIRDGAPRKRVGIQPEGRAPAREGTVIAAKDGTEIGRVTSGGFGPSLDGPLATGYVTADHAKIGTALDVVVRGKAMPAHVARLPFVPQRYYKA
jgi:aminomethyltransferase